MRFAAFSASRLTARLLPTGEAAVRIIGAADEGAELTDLEAQASRTARGAGAWIAAGLGAGEDMRPKHLVQGVKHLGDAEIADILHGGDELAPEVAQHVLPSKLAGRNQIELFLEIGGEIVFDVATEEILEERRDQPALVLGIEPLLVEPDIFPVAQNVERGGIGRGPADAELLHLLDQARFGIAGRRLGEMLLRLDLAAFELVALGQHGEGAILSDDIVGAFLIELEEAVEADHRARGAQSVGDAVLAGDLDLGRRAFDFGA